MIYSLLYSAIAFNTLSAEPIHEHASVQRTLSVTGSAEIKVLPDLATISLTVLDRGVDLQRTQRENTQTIQQFIDYLTKDLSIDPAHIQTNQIEVYPEYQYCNYDTDRKCDPLSVQYYSVMKQIQIHLDDLADYEPLLQKAFDVGISQINHVEFQSSNLRKYKDQAREKAAIAAKEKADAVAKSLGVVVLKPISIQLNATEHSPYVGYNASSRAMTNTQSISFESSGESTLTAGQLSIGANVNVVFEIE